jgi:hypothetical protein
MHNYRQTLNSLTREVQFMLINIEAKSLLRRKEIECTYSEKTSKQSN